MTKKEFRAAMLSGLGRCVEALRQDPEKYRELVLWACQRNIAYDAQCEGTRSWYVYTLASCYANREPFIQAAAQALKAYRPTGSWDLLHLAELLMFFAQDGFEEACQAVEDKYRELLAAMRRRKRRPNRLFYELDDLEQLGLVLAEDYPSTLRIAGDFGSLYQEKAYLQGGDFCWFFDSKVSRYARALAAAAEKDPKLACFLQKEQASQAARAAARQARGPQTMTGVRLSRWLLLHADTETVERYAKAYREQTEPELRARQLEAFLRCPYPGDPQPLLEDIGSACADLQRAAWWALENIRHPAVREFALENVRRGVRSQENFSVLVTNYVPQDAGLLEELLRECIAAGDRDDIHTACMDIGRAFDRDSGIPHPKHLLPLLYEHNPCSCCRAFRLKDMSKHRMLTKELLEECLYDSDEDIRCYARKRLKASIPIPPPFGEGGPA